MLHKCKNVRDKVAEGGAGGFSVDAQTKQMYRGGGGGGGGGAFSGFI